MKSARNITISKMDHLKLDERNHVEKSRFGFWFTDKHMALEACA